MGAKVALDHGYVHVEVPSGRLRGAEMVFDMPTVTGTENLMCAAALAKGRTTLVNAAREPEIEELASVLNKMGASVDGAGTDVIIIEGKEDLHPVDHAIIADRIEAGTYMVAAAATGGDVLLDGLRARAPRCGDRQAACHGRAGRARRQLRPRLRNTAVPPGGHHHGPASGLPYRHAGAADGAAVLGRRALA